MSDRELEANARGPAGLAMPRDVSRAHTLARLLDRRMLDPVLGLVLPGAGDLLGSALGVYIVAVAVRRGVSPVVIARMLVNLAIDAAIGIVPLVGDLGDLAFRANTRNLRLLTEHREPGRATVRDWLAVAGAVLVFAAALALAIVALVAAVRAIASRM